MRAQSVEGSKGKSTLKISQALSKKSVVHMLNASVSCNSPIS